jgi:hypothetical protein
MKKVTILIALLFALIIIIDAQIPNSGFENWIPYGNGQVPNGWWCANDSVSSTTDYFPITRSTDHYPEDVGSYSIRIANNPSLLPTWGAMGIVWTGGWRGNDYPAFPLIGHPTSLCGYYKFLPQNDSMRILICLYYNGVEVTQSELLDPGIAAVWTPFTIPIPGYTNADSARIMLSTFDADDFLIHGSSVLYVDNLSFDTLITSVESAKNTKGLLHLYPDPAFDYVTIRIDGILPKGLVLNVYNGFGELVKTELVKQNKQQFYVGDLNNGIYLVEIKAKGWSEQQKLIINRNH